MRPADLKAVVPTGLLSFPVTDFDRALNFDPWQYAARLEWLMPFGASALFAAGGTGEFFSLTPAEYRDVISIAVSTCRGRTPIIAGAGYGTALAIEFAHEAERVGASGILLLPPYLTESDPTGLRDHVLHVCRSTRLGVIVYHRANARFDARTLAELADACPNLIGFKDGVGDIEAMVTIRATLGDRLVYLGGLPTAEVYAAAYLAMGVPTYSSAVFNFIPRTALEFHRAVTTGDRAVVDRLLHDFFLPYLAIRNRKPGYAVSIVKAGVRVVGKDAGPVRPPLTELTEEEEGRLGALVRGLKESVN